MKFIEKISFKRAAAFCAFALALAVIVSYSTAINAQRRFTAELPQTDAAAATSTFKIVSQTAAPGTQVVVPIEIDSLGTEVAASFTINFDPTKLSSPALTLGNGVPAGMALTANMNQVASGKIGLLVDSGTAFVASPPSRQVMTITFSVAAGAATGDTPITFGSTPTPRSTSDPNGELLATNYQDGFVTISGQSVQPVSVSGRVFTPTGQGLRNAVVIMTSPQGQRTQVLTSSLGFFTFDSVVPGQTYTFAVSSKRYRFSAQHIQVTDNLSNLSFTGVE